MTDILTHLAAIRSKDDELLKKACPFCGSICGSAKHDDGVFWWKCDSCEASGPSESRYQEENDPHWNHRPREDALIALVREAVGEIERLTGYLRAARNAESKMDLVAITDEAFGIYRRAHNPQESEHG